MLLFILERLFEYVTTMVCVAVKGKPIIGVIHKPFLKQTYWAWVGKEKSKNIIIKKASRNQKLIIISRSHSGKIQEVITKSFFHPFNLVKAAGAENGEGAALTVNGERYRTMIRDFFGLEWMGWILRIFGSNRTVLRAILQSRHSLYCIRSSKVP
ncbi:unnamed protein product [Brassicogethes aeneus]|uniref:inositol-phosphate phosphatase n=1 Tax=Brassicogethes aeneus TaxID=1431903 RepID=A0A9P0ARD0_BRAAE|nr:unnamed protein product [Brassicogethes aeneus]